MLQLRLHKGFLYVFIAILCFFYPVFAEGSAVRIQSASKSKQVYTDKADSILKQMSLEEKVAQMIIIRTDGKTDLVSLKKMQELITEYAFGGVCFFSNDAWSVYNLIKEYQKVSSIPLFTTIDGEWGPAMRLRDVMPFPMQQTLGAIQDTHYIVKMGAAIGEQCKNLGILFNYIPVMDVNNNALNPVINMRSFGESPHEVAIRGEAYYKGMASMGIMGSVKHFPGHGDTKTDSHFSLPVINHDSAFLHDVDLYPFRHMINCGIESIMVGHLNVPAVDNVFPTSLSSKWIKEILRNKMNFEGLVITDGLEMKGVLQDVKPGSGETEVRAVEAGEDLLLLPVDPKAAVKAIVKAVKGKRISEARIDSSVYRILKSKGKLGLFSDYSIKEYSDSASLLSELNTTKYEALNNDLYNRAVTIVEDERALLPLQANRFPNKACLHIGQTSSNRWFSAKAMEMDYLGQTIDKYTDFDHFYINKDVSSDTADFIFNILNSYDLVLISVTKTSSFISRNYGITKPTLAYLDKLQTLPGEVILTMFTPPYALSFTDSMYFSSLICGYQDNKSSQQAVAQVLFGAIPAKGKLPVGVGERWPLGSGKTTVVDALAYVIPEQIGLKTDYMSGIDSIVQIGLDSCAYPGCQVLIAHKGQVFYNKSFGYYNYYKSQDVNANTLYDLASLTKSISTTLAYMIMYDRGLYDLDEPISKVINRLQRTNKKNISFRELLSHESGLKATIPYVNKDKKYKGSDIFSNTQSDAYPDLVSDSLYLIKAYRKAIRDDIDKSELLSKTYRYSDLGFYYLYEAGSIMLGEDLGDFVQRYIYDSLALEYIGFNPLTKHALSHIAPTENDTVLRNRQIRAYVHDPLVALLGGKGGSAGLFSNVENVAVIAQMLLQNGTYGGKRFIDSNTIKMFTSSDFSSKKNRRSGGFDKPAEKGTPSPCTDFASKQSYGHSGFTGTYFWVDPEKDLIYIFLSNRVYPSAKENKLSKLSIRTKIQEYVYKLWEDYMKIHPEE